MSAEDQEKFQSTNKCWVCNQLFDIQDNKVRDHCDTTGKDRRSTHWSSNINLGLTKKVSVIFHNLRGYGSH